MFSSSDEYVLSDISASSNILLPVRLLMLDFNSVARRLERVWDPRRMLFRGLHLSVLSYALYTRLTSVRAGDSVAVLPVNDLGIGGLRRLPGNMLELSLVGDGEGVSAGFRIFKQSGSSGSGTLLLSLSGGAGVMTASEDEAGFSGVFPSWFRVVGAL
jgi:hypothetical protein